MLHLICCKCTWQRRHFCWNFPQHTCNHYLCMSGAFLLVTAILLNISIYNYYRYSQIVKRNIEWCWNCIASKPFFCRGKKTNKQTTKKAVVGKKAFTVYWSISSAYRNRQNKEPLWNRHAHGNLSISLFLSFPAHLCRQQVLALVSLRCVYSSAVSCPLLWMILMMDWTTSKVVPWPPISAVCNCKKKKTNQIRGENKRSNWAWNHFCSSKAAWNTKKREESTLLLCQRIVRPSRVRVRPASEGLAGNFNRLCDNPTGK